MRRKFLFAGGAVVLIVAAAYVGYAYFVPKSSTVVNTEAPASSIPIAIVSAGPFADGERGPHATGRVLI